MNDGTPTVGDLERENEELRREIEELRREIEELRREIEDLKARMDTVEEPLGLLDGEEEEKESGTGLSEAVREYLYYEGEL